MGWNVRNSEGFGEDGRSRVGFRIENIEDNGRENFEKILDWKDGKNYNCRENQKDAEDQCSGIQPEKIFVTDEGV